MKQAAVSLGNKFTVYTKTHDKYYKICMEFQVMAACRNKLESLKPTQIEISYQEYKQHHPFLTVQ